MQRSSDQGRGAAVVLAVVLCLVQLATIWTLLVGAETLFLRDVLTVHLPAKAAQAAELAAGRLPSVDPYRGHLPLSGNPNLLPFYPDNAVYLVAATLVGPVAGSLWSLNAHFWLHWLAASLAMWWLARAWGVSRLGALAAAAAYSFSGFALSHLSFYNLIGGLALTPALVAATIETLEGRRRGFVALGLVWALLLLAGDPTYAALALLLALGAAAAAASDAWPGFGRGLRRAGLAMACGTVIALPQIVEFLRILPVSTRGAHGFATELRAAASFQPLHAIEWVVPLFFGRIDRLGDGRFWAHAHFLGELPFYVTLAPGLIVLALALAAGWRGRRRLWSITAIAAGVFVGLGGYNPLLRPLLELPITAALRFPVKAWLAVSVGLALLVGLGYERVFERRERGARRRLCWGLGVSLLVLVVLLLAPLGSWFGELLPERLGGDFLGAEVERWRRGLAESALLVAAAGGATVLARRRSGWGVVVVALHATGQLLLLASAAMPRDAAAPYRRAPAVLSVVADSERVVHGALDRLLGGPPAMAGDYPRDGPDEVPWFARRAAAELYPFMGVRWGIAYDLWLTPEGLDPLLARLAHDAVEMSGDPERLRLLETWGVSTALTTHRLGPPASPPRAALRHFGVPLFVYRLPAAVPEVRLVGEVGKSEGPRTALQSLLEPGFDPARQAIVAGSWSRSPAPAGRIEGLASDPERVVAAVSSEGGGLLVIQRPHLPLYRASVDGEEVEVRIADLFRLGVEVPPGRHRVAIWVDRTPLVAALLLAPLGALALVLLAARVRRPARSPAASSSCHDHGCPAAVRPARSPAASGSCHDHGCPAAVRPARSPAASSSCHDHGCPAGW